MEINSASNVEKEVSEIKAVNCVLNPLKPTSILYPRKNNIVRRGS